MKTLFFAAIAATAFSAVVFLTQIGTAYAFFRGGAIALLLSIELALLAFAVLAASSRNRHGLSSRRAQSMRAALPFLMAALLMFIPIALGIWSGIPHAQINHSPV